METIFKICALALAAVIACTLLRQQNHALTVLLSITAASLIIITVIQFFHPILAFLANLRDLSQLDDETTLPVIKVLSIGTMSHIASQICSDAGESALGKVVELGGSILSLYAALPLLSAILAMIERGLGITS